ncbi:MAG: vitamin B12-dependent ribonucleotide reductase [Anaerolineae bacterium]
MGVQTLSFTENATTVLERRYLAKNAEGQVIETPEAMLLRVATALAAADQLYTLSNDTSLTADEFYNVMARLDFLPNSPTLMNAGTSVGQLSACFVLPVEDSMDRIFDAVKATALIHQSGGGTGFSFSRLRPSGDIVGSTGGIASGPVSFMRVFDTATDVIKQGGRRRGANMGILRVDHPDIEAFIESKQREGTFANFNISVAVTDAFMQALSAGREYDLVNPRNGQVVKRLRAADVFDKVVEGTWRNGEPGVVFIDRMNAFNPTPQLGDYEATNPCGEQVLLPWESCNLGSINLARMVTPRRTVDWERLRSTVRLAVHMMDNVITVNRWPLPVIGEATLKTRKIGLGVMGFADMLLALNVAYDSVEAEMVAGRVMEAISYWSKEASCELAMARGAFPAFPDSRWAQGWLPIPEGPSGEPGNGSLPCLADRPPLDWRELGRRIRKVGIRNATTTTIAPTGTISIIAGCSSGIEPLFALAYTRKHVLDADELPEVNPLFAQVAREGRFDRPEILAAVAKHGSCREIEDIPADVRAVFATAHDVSPTWHVRMQAAFQRYTDNAVSKTINFPHEATQEQVRQAFLLAYELGCKGLTMYRDGSRDAQVLNVGVEGKGNKEAHAAAPARGLQESRAPRPRPIVTHGSTEKIVLGCGRTLYITINRDDLGLCEVFLQMGKAGGCTAAYSDAVGRLVSLALRSGIETPAIVRQLKGLRCPSPSWHNGGSTLSCPDAIAKAIERFVGGGQPDHGRSVTSAVSRDKVTLDMCPECPECGSMVEFVEGCAVCRSCGYSQCS